MGALLLSWFAKEGVGLLLGFFGNLFMDFYNKKKADQALQDAARLEVERDQAREGERVQTELADQAGKRVEEDDAISRLEKGEG